ncbi:MAG: DUF6157 family protein [Candidatus Methylacidiphilales bacterium]
MSTNYTNTFITIASDSKLRSGTKPSKEGTIAAMQYELIHDNPYTYTSDDILFITHARRQEIPKTQWDAARKEFFSKSKACLRASPLVKHFGWGLHHDGQGRVAMYGAETERYKYFTEQSDVKVVAGMRSARA